MWAVTFFGVTTSCIVLHPPKSRNYDVATQSSQKLEEVIQLNHSQKVIHYTGEFQLDILFHTLTAVEFAHNWILLIKLVDKTKKCIMEIVRGMQRAHGLSVLESNATFS
jgi:uncharacterized membrane protein YciS (DUF1049 family)